MGLVREGARAPVESSARLRASQASPLGEARTREHGPLSEPHSPCHAGVAGPFRRCTVIGSPPLLNTPSIAQEAEGSDCALVQRLGFRQLHIGAGGLIKAGGAMHELTDEARGPWPGAREPKCENGLDQVQGERAESIWLTLDLDAGRTA